MKRTFEIGEEVGIDMVVSIEKTGANAKEHRYRVRTGCCGAEIIYGHPTLVGRKRMGRKSCVNCSKMSEALKKSMSIRIGMEFGRKEKRTIEDVPGWGSFLKMPKQQAKKPHRKTSNDDG